MLSRYSMFAGYNAWCNERLYDATSRMTTLTIARIEVSFLDPCTARSTTSW